VGAEFYSSRILSIHWLMRKNYFTLLYQYDSCVKTKIVDLKIITLIFINQIIRLFTIYSHISHAKQKLIAGNKIISIVFLLYLCAWSSVRSLMRWENSIENQVMLMIIQCRCLVRYSALFNDDDLNIFLCKYSSSVSFTTKE
jgi:hypothetical protein